MPGFWVMNRGGCWLRLSVALALCPLWPEPGVATPAQATSLSAALTHESRDALDAAPTTKAAFAPSVAPSLPSVDHVNFDDDFAFENGASVASTPRGTSTVELVDLDDDIEPIAIDEDEDLRAELPELAGFDDDTLTEATEAETTTTEDISGLLEDDDDIELDW